MLAQRLVNYRKCMVVACGASRMSAGKLPFAQGYLPWSLMLWFDWCRHITSYTTINSDCVVGVIPFEGAV